MQNAILTTTEVARLLGVSVRTAQTLIEGGALTSWKTPGGHRRVYREDVLALISQKNQDQKHRSARVVLVGNSPHLLAIEAELSKVQGCSIDSYADAYSVGLAIGLNRPAVVIIDLTDKNKERLALLRNLTSNADLSSVHFVAIGASRSVAAENNYTNRVTFIASRELLAETVRNFLRTPLQLATLMEEGLPFPIAVNEGDRLAALENSGLLDTPQEERFDRLTRLAGQTLDAPVALFTMLTPTLQRFKSRLGLKIKETPRSWAFCNHTILQRNVFAVDNLTLAPHFANNPAVKAGPKFRFYAGAPVLDADGFALGSLCVLDYKARALDSNQMETLRTLAHLASDAVQLRAAESQLRQARARR